MAATLCQGLGFFLSLIGIAGIIAATGMDQWATQDLFDNVVTAVYSYSGLWRSCVRQSSGFTECRPYFTILGLPGQFLISAATAMDMWSLQDRSLTVVTSVYTYSGLWKSCVGTVYGTTQCRPYFTILGLPALLQAVRALMIVGIVLGAIGLLIAIFSLKCLKMGNMEDNLKATMTLSAGIMLLLAGVCGIAGVSAFANLIVQSFQFTTFASGFSNTGGLTGTLTPRYTFGSALFVGWIGGAILFIGGILMCLACRGMTPEKNQGYDGMAYKAASQSAMYRSDTRSRPVYNDSYKAQSMDGRQANQRFDYV